MTTKNQTWKVSGVTTEFPSVGNPKKTIISTVINDGVNSSFELEIAHILPSTRKKENTAIIVNSLEMLNVLNELMEAFEEKGHLLNFDVNLVRKVLDKVNQTTNL